MFFLIVLEESCLNDESVDGVHGVVLSTNILQRDYSKAETVIPFHQHIKAKYPDGKKKHSGKETVQI